MEQPKFTPEEIAFARWQRPPQPQPEFTPEEIAFARGGRASGTQPEFTPEEVAFAKKQQAHELSRRRPLPSGLDNVLKSTGGAVMSGFEKLDRPRSMVVAGIQAMQGDRPASDVWEAVKGNVHPSFSEVLPDMNVPAPRWIDPDDDGKVNLKHAVGFGLDILGDPLTYLTFGALTKMGKAGKALAAISRVHGEDVMRGLIAKSPETVAALRAKGVSQRLIDLAMKADVPLAKTLPEQAKAGQWTAAKFAGFSAPKAVNVPVAKGVDAARRGMPKVPIINKFINRSGDDLWDEGVKNLDYQHRRRTNEIMDTGMATRRAGDELGPEAFGGKSSAAWHESEGGVWMDNLLNRRFGTHKPSAEQLKNYRRATSLRGKEDDIVREGQRVVSELMKKDFPEINGVKPYFAPGGKDTTFEGYVLHQICGGAQDGVVKKPSSGRLAGLSLVDESLSNPDFIFQQKNGNRYWGTVYQTGKKDTLHVVVTEMERDGRVREVTQFPVKGKGNEIKNAIGNKFGDSTLEYISEGVKNGGPSKRPAPTASSQHPYPGLGSAGDSNNIVNLSREAVNGNVNGRMYPSSPPPSVEPVKLAMSQRVTRLTNEQRELMKRLGIPLEQIDEAGYAYVPHTLTEEAAKEARPGVFSGFRNGNLPNKKTPQALPRDYRWITDPATGEESVGSVRRFAEERGLDPAALTTRNATVDEINSALGADKFKGDLAEATTEAALRNERAISGAEALKFFYDGAKADLERVGGVAPSNWRRPRLEVPQRFISQDGKTFPVRDTLARLAETPMPPEKARIIEARWKMVAKPDESARQLKELYMGYESAWKRFTLFLFPEYHSRNMIGDLWNGWMHGWKPHHISKDLHDAARLQMSGGKGRSMGAGVYGTLRGEDVIKAARDHGVIGTGQLSEIKDILAPINSPKGRSIARKIKEQAWDLKGAVAVGEALENNRRLGFFLRRLKEGDTFEEAAKVVANALYDYGDITPFESNVMKRAFPFYTWSRKNIPAQMENLVRHPGKVSVMPKLKGAFEGAQDGDIPPEDVRPEWMRREFSIYGGKNPDGKENFTMLGSYLPTSDVFKFGSSPEDIMANVASSISPPIKVAAELAMNRDFYRDKPIDQLREGGNWENLLYGNERTNYLGMNMPTTAQRLSEVLPFTRALSTLDRMNPGGIFDQYAATDDGKTRPYHTELTGGQKWLKTLTGLKNYPVDLERDFAYRLKDLKSDSSKAPGLNEANIKMMARRAYLEGDIKSYEFYLKLLDDVSEKMDQEIGLWEQYAGSR